ncbi:hypothetical protein B0H63DRAFT_141637 [Podospora didyma]|uniref:Uncharacterized protein n=1 Tax=Podospora didyma TaxID=330526 RepID=A0AAE0NSV3_9PEZI|nr:hypothetical protein B0H63DRAFT_141637 [Podospora didyma]
MVADTDSREEALVDLAALRSAFASESRFDLKHPSESWPSQAASQSELTPSHTFPLSSQNEDTDRPNLRRNLKPIKSLISSFFVYLIFTILYALFIYSVLIKKNPQVGALLLDASTANLLISVFSQVFVIASDALICGLLDSLRTALAGRARGTSASAFFGIGAATAWPSVFWLALVNRFRDIWCNFRVLLPILGLVFGSVLKFQATFDYHFAPGPIRVPVYAGVIPMDTRLIEAVRTGDLWVYFQSFTATFLENPRYAAPYALGPCDGSGACRAALLPGGLELARQVSPNLNLTVFHGGIFNNVEAIRIERSRGVALTYETPVNGSVFNWAQDCMIAGEQMGDGVQLCVRQEGESVIAGWTSCPELIFQAKQCSLNRSWMNQPMEWSTKMTAFKQFTTVTYDRTNGTIIDVKATPDPNPQHMPLDATDYRRIWNKILLLPKDNTSTTPLIQTKVNSILYDLTWLHRTYQVSFPDQKQTPVNYLHNFLAVPLQFSIVAHEFVNYTHPLIAQVLGGLPLPEEMQTVAVSGWSSSRLIIQEWTGWVFISGSVAVLVSAMVCIVWIATRPDPLFSTTGVPELDILRVTEREGGGGQHGYGVIDDMPVRNTSSSVARGRQPGNLTTLPNGRVSRGVPSGWRLALSLRHWRIRAVSSSDGIETRFVVSHHDATDKRRRPGPQSVGTDSC